MSATWRDWLLAETPASRRQAALGRWYRGWRGLRRNPLAMVGLGVVVLLVLVAVLAPVLTLQSPYRQDLAGRLGEQPVAQREAHRALGSTMR